MISLFKVGPTNPSIAHEVLRQNLYKISTSSIDVYSLAADLYSSNAIPAAVHGRTIDRYTALSAYERLHHLLGDVAKDVKFSGGVFDKLLSSLRKVGQRSLADDLYQQYSK